MLGYFSKEVNNLKKLKYLLMLLILIPIGVRASDTYYIAMEKDGEIDYYPYEITKVNYATYFAISLSLIHISEPTRP